jgi:hypothetical protein
VPRTHPTSEETNVTDAGWKSAGTGVGGRVTAVVELLGAVVVLLWEGKPLESVGVVWLEMETL